MTIKLTETAIEVPKTLSESFGFEDTSLDLIKAYKRLDAEKDKCGLKTRIEVLTQQTLCECSNMGWYTGILLATLKGYALGLKVAGEDSENNELRLKKQIEQMKKKIQKLERSPNPQPPEGRKETIG